MSSAHGRVAVYVLIVPVKYPEIVPACTNGGNGKKKEFMEEGSLLRMTQEMRLTKETKNSEEAAAGPKMSSWIIFIRKRNVCKNVI